MKRNLTMNKLNTAQLRLLNNAIKDKKAPLTIDLDLKLYNKVKGINPYGWIHNDINKYLEKKRNG